MSINGCEPGEWINDHGSTERAVAPVIGIILMVAIAVVLAGVIGIMVFGIADDLGDAAPSASLSIDDVTDNQSDDHLEFTIEHDGGDSILVEDLNVVIDGTTKGDVDEIAGEGTFEEGQEFSSGESVTLALEDDYYSKLDSSSQITLIHAPSDSIIGSYDVQTNDID